jgi:ribosome modulation factor
LNRTGVSNQTTPYCHFEQRIEYLGLIYCDEWRNLLNRTGVSNQTTPYCHFEQRIEYLGLIYCDEWRKIRVIIEIYN